MTRKNNYVFQIMHRNKPITFTDYADFLNEIRGIKLSEFSVKINVLEGCESSWITVDSNDFYLKKCGDKNFPGPYPNDPLNTISYILSWGELVQALQNINSILSKSSHANFTLPIKDSIILAFFISEAARFEIVERAAHVMLLEPHVSFSWNDWKPLLNNWNTLSKNFDKNCEKARPLPICATEYNPTDSIRVKIYQGSNLNSAHIKANDEYQNIFEIPEQVSTEFSEPEPFFKRAY